MTRLLLHVGHPKTGTTALQSVLAANAARLANQSSILYPTRTTPTAIKHALAIPWLLGVESGAIRRAASEDNREKLKRLSKKYWESITREIVSMQASDLILSAEGFWILHKASSDNRASFVQTIGSIAHYISIAGYLKSPASYFLSMLNQKLRNFRPVELPRPHYYKASIEAWETLGFDSYNWRIFDRKYLEKGDIVEDFCKHNLPHALDSSQLRRDGFEKANASVSNEALVILEELAVKYPELKRHTHDDRRRKIIEILREEDILIGGDYRPSLTEAATEAITSRCKDLAWLQARGLLFPDVNPSLIGASDSNTRDVYTKVSDFCPINTERLAGLRSAVIDRIDLLFVDPIRNQFWPFKRLRRTEN